MWKWMKSWFVKEEKSVEFPTLILTIKPNLEAPAELLAHFKFDWPSGTKDETLAVYYGRVLAYIQSGALYSTIMSGFAIKYAEEKGIAENSAEVGMAQQILHNEFQRIMKKIMESKSDDQQMLEHFRQPCMMPSDVFNIRNKMEKNG
jgi:hypothetical protein